jgi:hypothetical protein
MHALKDASAPDTFGAFAFASVLARAFRRVATVEFRRHYVTQWVMGAGPGVETPA